MTPNTSAASSLWRNSVRTIGDILVLSDIINPHAYFALPFVNQAWFVAGCCYVKEIEMHASNPSRPVSRVVSPATSPRRSALAFSSLPAQQSHLIDDDDESDSGSDESESQPPPQVDMSRALLTSVATTNINTLKSGLEKLAQYWYGAEWIAGTLQQRIAGMHDVDLVSVRENFASYVSLPDAGAARSGAGTDTPAIDEGLGMGMGLGMGEMEMSSLDFLSLPFDLAEGGGQVTETDVPLPMFPYPVS